MTKEVTTVTLDKAENGFVIKYMCKGEYTTRTMIRDSLGGALELAGELLRFKEAPKEPAA